MDGLECGRVRGVAYFESDWHALDGETPRLSAFHGTAFARGSTGAGAIAGGASKLDGVHGEKVRMLETVSVICRPSVI